MELLNQISEALQQGKDQIVLEKTKEAITQDLPVTEILNTGLIAGMDIIGKQFRNQEIFLPDVLLAARAMHAGMGELKPLLIKEGVSSRGKVVLGTVSGDLHDIGKNLVGIMLEGAGFEVIDLGVDVSAEQFVEAAEKNEASIIGMSALLTTTMPGMKEVTDLIKSKGFTGKIKTVVGGAPLSEKSAADLGADYYASNAASAVDCVKEIIA